MPDQNKSNGEASPFEIITPGKSKKATSRGLIITLAVVLFLVLSIVAGVLLVRQQQDIREKAAQIKTCPQIEACPDPQDPKTLRNCTPPEIGNNPTDSLCTASFKGRIESCGGRQYCCQGQVWVLDMSACASATATATAAATATGTAAATSTATGKATSTAKSTATAASTKTSSPTAAPATTAQPIPSTGTGWPTYAGIGIGVVVIIASILLAL
ncbi:MAG: hypothetical protein UX13_C0014G0013 [Candidatus Woesebacteria bacterium GW2011_GWB1_45_5]|uniref:Uncharacterized protein n=1 Tax=Candidatus Woesebacteria bacterium GW2011_GWB1_45_5 TaxID=1618581 RepID=A0A0G1QNY4_9BACT|nr:MAG: hypothetical protein UX13_C0014G0013 [Candidatus Woesebacteria bacterium GW2011_GWB1_45_5]